MGSSAGFVLNNANVEGISQEVYLRVKGRLLIIIINIDYRLNLTQLHKSM